LAGSGGTLSCSVDCPEGYTVLSGGYECSLVGTSGAAPTDATCNTDIYVKQSRPQALGAGWTATWRNASSGAISAEVITYAYCAIVEGCSVSNPIACGPPDPP
jgi:hypothetical protein